MNEKEEEIYDRGYNQGFIAGQVAYRTATVGMLKSLKALGVYNFSTEKLIELFEKVVESGNL